MKILHIKSIELIHILSFDINNSDSKASLKQQKSQETTTDTQDVSKFYWF